MSARLLQYRTLEAFPYSGGEEGWSPGSHPPLRFVNKSCVFSDLSYTLYRFCTRLQQRLNIGSIPFLNCA
jgi:hypothetical protein